MSERCCCFLVGTCCTFFKTSLNSSPNCKLRPAASVTVSLSHTVAPECTTRSPGRRIFKKIDNWWKFRNRHRSIAALPQTQFNWRQDRNAPLENGSETSCFSEKSPFYSQTWVGVFLLRVLSQMNWITAEDKCSSRIRRRPAMFKGAVCSFGKEDTDDFFGSCHLSSFKLCSGTLLVYSCMKRVRIITSLI